MVIFGIIRSTKPPRRHRNIHAGMATLGKRELPFSITWRMRYLRTCHEHAARVNLGSIATMNEHGGQLHITRLSRAIPK